MNKYITINELVKRDTVNEKYKLYQFQANKDDAMCNVVYIGEYEHIPIVPIFDKNIGDLQCTLVSFLVTDKEIDAYECNMIGFLISNKENITASLILSFVPGNKITVNNTNTNAHGTFEVNLFTKQKGINIKKNIKTYNKYLGKEEFIYELTELLATVL